MGNTVGDILGGDPSRRRKGNAPGTIEIAPQPNTRTCDEGQTMHSVQRVVCEEKILVSLHAGGVIIVQCDVRSDIGQYIKIVVHATNCAA